MLFKSEGPCHQRAAGCVSHVSSMAPVFLLDAQDQLSPGPIVSNLVQILNILLKNDVRQEIWAGLLPASTMHQSNHIW